MTACVNKKSKRVAAVVTASLVGALSIGAPAVAMAAGSGDIQLLAADWYTGATVTKATDGKGGEVSGDLSKATFETGKWLVPTQVKNSNGDVTNITSTDFVLNYYMGDDLKATTDLEKVGNGATYKTPATFFGNATDGIYSVEIVKGKRSDGDSKSGKFFFKVSSAAEDELEGAYAFVGADSSDKQITYTGASIISSLNFAKADGTKLVKGSVSGQGDYDEVTVYKADGTVDNGVSATNAGNYTAVLTSDSKEVAAITFTVGKLDFSKAVVTRDDVLASAGVNSTDKAGFIKSLEINGTKLTSGEGLTLHSVKGPDGKLVDITDDSFFTKTNIDKGKYVATISAAGDANITAGTQDVAFYALHKDVYDDCSGKVLFNGEAITSGITIDLSKGEKFDASKVSVSYTDSKYATQTVSGDQLSLSFTDNADKPVSLDDVVKAGTSSTFKVKVRVNALKGFADDMWYGGTSSVVNITVKGTDLDADASLAFYIDGKVAGDEASMDYDGTDALKKLGVVVKSGDKTYEQGSDYTLEITDKATGKAVTEAVNHGTYTVAVKPITFSFKGGTGKSTFELTIDKVELSKLIPSTDTYADGTFGENGDLTGKAKFYVPYTGKAIDVPGVKYAVTEDGKTTFVELDSSLYRVVSISYNKNVVNEIVKADEKNAYTVTIALTDAAAKNYSLTDSDQAYKFFVREFGHFADVDSAEWYSVAVEKAYDLKYVNGISGTNLFAPKADITRADAVCILFNMASGKLGTDGEFGFTEDKGYVTGFSDVDGHAYFAKALAWAKASGVANGSNGQFRPYDKITREEFASLLANFAKSKGDYEAVDADEVLAGATDYTGWAKENVAWAKANKIMGNGGLINGTGNITRAEVAAMAVNYQPEALPAVPEN